MSQAKASAQPNTYFNTLGGCFNEYMLNQDNLPPLIPDRKIISNITTKNQSSVIFGAKNNKSYNSQLSGNYLYKDVMNGDNKDYGNSWNVSIKPVEKYDAFGSKLLS
jgi:hypothetical protein